MDAPPDAIADERAKPSGLVAAFLVCTCGLLIWAGAALVVGWEQLVLHAPRTESAGLVAAAVVPYGALSGFGTLLVRSTLGKQHPVARVTTWAYLVLLGAGLAAAVLCSR